MQLFQRALYSTFFFFSFQVYGQIAIDNNSFTVNQLVDGILIPAGSGTTISNVTFSGVYNNAGRYQIGHFSTATSTLADMQFAEGIVLSSGNTSDLPLALGTDPGSVAQMSTGYTSCTPGEIRRTGTCGVLLNDLDVLSEGENYFNAAILEFDFVPVNDFVEFRYVFGGEEYMDDIGFINYQCTEFNDRFGFLISGPGIIGGQGFDNDAENIATLANGSFVGINSVNNGIVGSSAVPNGASFCQNANPSWLQNASTAEYGGIIDGTQLNGNTIALTASKTNLIPGQTYHIKLLITDVSDAAYDAVVYLEAGSFTTEAPCGISAITSGTQTACDPLTNEYTQEVTVTFTNPPSTGNLVVNGQTFAIGTSPQTVVLTGLTSDGLSVDVTANFDALPGCSLTVTNVFTAPTDCTPTPCGISAITAGTQTACDPLTNEYTQEVTVTFTNPPATGNLVVNGQAFAIGTSPQTVVLTGLTSDGLSVDVTANFDALPGCSLTVTDVFTAPTVCTPTPCGISAITASTQTACDPLINEYTQEVTVTFTNPPATGNLVVNGQTFAIGTSPLTVVLTGLTSDGLSVDVTANFDALPGCSLTVTDVFTAPIDCNIECGELYVPTAFSPNNDQNNDTYMFRLNELCVESMNLSIYNRWGERVFISENMSNEWDGTYREQPAENGVYVYKLIIKIAGESDERVLTGNVNLIR